MMAAIMIAAVTGGLIVFAFITDIWRRRIPNALTLTGWLAGLGLHAVYSGGSGVLHAVIGTAIGFIPMLLLYLIKAVGAGDVKLFAAIGALTGGEMVLQSMLYSLFYAGLVGCLILLWRQEWKQTSQRIVMMLIGFLAFKDMAQWKPYIRSGHHVRFPFMWAVLPAVATVYLQFP
ncbi:prepilin peptidase [Paenibacillus sp. NPDC056579]|uniref:A24 family peptidase n=1 Tax=unclassified Paenibacillus TaxID=185978 RepID=UPI001EF811AF|nr:prepilin peptidase [Paenibacillus sp. H1-7]